MTKLRAGDKVIDCVQPVKLFLPSYCPRCGYEELNRKSTCASGNTFLAALIRKNPP